jgi:hypothetical protein
MHRSVVVTPTTAGTLEVRIYVVRTLTLPDRSVDCAIARCTLNARVVDRVSATGPLTEPIPTDTAFGAVTLEFDAVAGLTLRGQHCGSCRRRPPAKCCEMSVDPGQTTLQAIPVGSLASVTGPFRYQNLVRRLTDDHPPCCEDAVCGLSSPVDGYTQRNNAKGCCHDHFRTS